MEAPRRASRAFPSARMLEAQRAFQTVVKQELQALLALGTRREVAVKLLLRRIVASTEAPEAAAVRGVMRQFQMNHDDAVRALIVKQELGRLKRQGLDSFAAIEELTKKMRQREDEEAGEEKQEAAKDEEEAKEEVKEAKNEVKEEEAKEMEEQTQEDGKRVSEMPSPSPSRSPSPSPTSVDKEKDATESSLSLIQRIGQVSISSGNTPEREAEQDGREADTDEESEAPEKKEKVFSSPARIRSPTSNLADLTPQTRKRRAAFGIQLETSGSRGNGRGVQPLFPSLKKQKLCAEVGDGFLQVVTRKSKPASSALSKNTSAAGSSGSSSHIGSGGGGSARGESSTKNVHKRQRASPTGMKDDDESPVSEELRVSLAHHRHHHGHHHSKRHKSGSTH